MRLIMNADDFGYSKGQNYGVLECMQHGCVTSTTLLTTMEGTEHAFELIKEHPYLDVGIHLTLDLGTPITPADKIPSLVDANGQLSTYDLTLDTLGVNPDEVYTEWKAQIEYAMKNGVRPSHFDSHHHIHMKEDVFEVFVKLAREYDVAIRYHSSHFPAEKKAAYDAQVEGIPRADLFTSAFYQEGVGLDFFKNLPHDQDILIEAMCHPAYLDETIQNRSSYNIQRIKEVTVLTSEELEHLIDETGIELVEYVSILED